MLSRTLDIERDSVNQALVRMANRGEAVRIRPGVYRYTGVRLKVKSTQKIRPRVFRAMHIRGVFAAREIADLAESDRRFVLKIANELEAAGALEQICTRKNFSNHDEKVYRVRDADSFYRDYVLFFEKVKTRKSNRIPTCGKLEKAGVKADGS
ncbi:MAG: hypothetical protein LLF99_04685 [Desulfobacteraceae bacterium]|nr:hypothetical protein [Desulfobacteraceae bacterium]